MLCLSKKLVHDLRLSYHYNLILTEGLHSVKFCKLQLQWLRKLNDSSFDSIVVGCQSFGPDAAHIPAHLDQPGNKPETTDENTHRSAEEHQGFSLFLATSPF